MVVPSSTTQVWQLTTGSRGEAAFRLSLIHIWRCRRIERCPYYRGVRKERFDCTLFRQCLIYMWSKALCSGRPNFAIYMLIKQVCFNTLKNDIFSPVVPSSTTQVWQLTTGSRGEDAFRPFNKPKFNRWIWGKNKCILSLFTKKNEVFITFTSRSS